MNLAILGACWVLLIGMIIVCRSRTPRCNKCGYKMRYYMTYMHVDPEQNEYSYFCTRCQSSVKIKGRE